MSGLRLQSAMEYLLTYGWAILIIAVVLGALSSLGFFNGANLAPKVAGGSCQIYRPYGPGSTAFINTEGECSNELPQYVALLNGQNYIAIPYSPALDSATSYTVIAWIRTTSASANSVFIGGYTSGNYYQVYLSGSNVGYGSGTATGSTAAPAVNNGAWHQVAAEIGGGGVSLYLDGRLVYTTSTSQVVGNLGSDAIGAQCASSGSCSDSFNGMIANVQVYNTSVSANEITAIYQEGIGGEPTVLNNLAGWWQLNGNLNDYSGNLNNGAGVGTVVFTTSWTSTYSPP